MKKVLFLLISISLMFFSCKSERQSMTLGDYAKMQTEINLPDPALDPQLVEKVVSKYGYTFDQYKEFNDKVEKDSTLREKLGEIRLKSQTK